MTHAPEDDRTGFDRLVDEDGVQRRLVGGTWLTPGKAIGLRDDHLEVDWHHALKTYAAVRVTQELLRDFAALSSADRHPDAVRRYARRAGLLDLCQHHLPNGHEPWPLPISMLATNNAFYPKIDCNSLVGKEPVSAWLYWSRQAAALLRVTDGLRFSKPVPQEDWDVLAEEAPWVAFEDANPTLRESASSWIAAVPKLSLDVQRDVVADAITAWLQVSGVRIAMTWSDGKPEVRMHEDNLLGAVGLGLLLAATGATGMTLCPRCGNRPAPRSTRGRGPIYCEDCRTKKVPQKAARIKYRSKPAVKEQNRLRAKANRDRKRRKEGAGPGGG